MMRDTKNVLLVKDDVGKGKPTTRDLPTGAFAYGKSAGHDPEGASEGSFPISSVVTRSWKMSKNSKDVMPEKDFKRLNAVCVHKKAVKAKVRSCPCSPFLSSGG